MQLQEILYGVTITELVGNTNREVVTLAFDSRKVVPGSVFFAIKGTLSDGHAFIDATISNGATVIVCEVMPSVVAAEITYIQVADPSLALGQMASNFYGNPSSKIQLVGITGTNGKTTIATLLFKLFVELGYKVGLISTVQNQINDEIIPATHTTPDPLALNELLDRMVSEGCGYCFMEVSSHAVVQHRVAGITFAGGVFSNITHDHLDFHGTFDNYIKAKRGFF
ncbi:MAG: UDP-N-acetylmuramoyl-L-alanyl-D-glutamate--2,6-diaminopimelate ligase, partial [Pedobacter sp.]